MSTLKILFFGDVVGKIGRSALIQKIPLYREKYQPHFIIVNAENLAHGFGITQQTIHELQTAGVDFFTSGNHIWDKKEGIALLEEKKSNILRPANYPVNNPGRGFSVVTVHHAKLLIINLIGRVFMKEDCECPFTCFDRIYKNAMADEISAIIVDFHAEATSEKAAFFHYVNGRVSAVLGTHTHVATADLRVSQQGTAFLTDVGMNGPSDSVIGHQKEQIIQRFLTQINLNHEVCETFPAQINAVFLEINTVNRRAERVEQIIDEIPT